MSDELICARCHLPVDLRDALHMGKHVVHDASICVTLLQSRLDSCRDRLDASNGELVKARIDQQAAEARQDELASMLAATESRLDAAEKLTEAVRQEWRDDREETRAERNAALKQRDELLLRLDGCAKALGWILRQTGPALIARDYFAVLRSNDLFEIVDDPAKDYLTVRLAPSVPSEHVQSSSDGTNRDRPRLIDAGPAEDSRNLSSAAVPHSSDAPAPSEGEKFVPARGSANTGPVAGRVIAERSTSDPSPGADDADRESPDHAETTDGSNGLIADGFGGQWERCELKTHCDLQIVRPGKAVCEGDDCPRQGRVKRILGGS